MGEESGLFKIDKSMPNHIIHAMGILSDFFNIGDGKDIDVISVEYKVDAELLNVVMTSFVSDQMLDTIKTYLNDDVVPGVSVAQRFNNNRIPQLDIKFPNNSVAESSTTYIQ